MTKQNPADHEPNFIIRKTWTPIEAVSLLIRRFPVVLDLGESESELKQVGPYYAYANFAGRILPDLSDKSVRNSVVKFIDELAESQDSLLEDVLITSVLEKIAEDPERSHEIRLELQQKGAELLRKVEEEMFGRFF